MRAATPDRLRAAWQDDVATAVSAPVGLAIPPRAAPESASPRSAKAARNRRFRCRSGPRAGLAPFSPLVPARRLGPRRWLRASIRARRGADRQALAQHHSAALVVRQKAVPAGARCRRAGTPEAAGAPFRGP